MSIVRNDVYNLKENAILMVQNVVNSLYNIIHFVRVPCRWRDLGTVQFRWKLSVTPFSRQPSLFIHRLFSVCQERISDMHLI